MLDNPPPSMPPAGVEEVTAWAIAVRMWREHLPKSLVATSCTGCTSSWPCAAWEVADGIIADCVPAGTLPMATPDPQVPPVTARTVLAGSGRHGMFGLGNAEDTSQNIPVSPVPMMPDPAPELTTPDVSVSMPAAAAAVGRVQASASATARPMMVGVSYHDAGPAGAGLSAGDPASTDFLPRVSDMVDVTMDRPAWSPQIPAESPSTEFRYTAPVPPMTGRAPAGEDLPILNSVTPPSSRFAGYNVF